MGGSSRGGTWEGHAPLKAALDALATAKGVSANRVKAVASAAFQFAKDYKRVVHDVEMFLWKAEVEHRLAGLYAMDAIMRQSQAKLGAKDMFVKRFLLHMNNTIAAVKKIPADQQEGARHVIQEWQSRGYYTPQDIENAGGREYSLNNSQVRAASTTSAATRASPTHAEPASKEKLASLLSIIKKQKELQDQSSEHPQAPLLSSPPPQRLRNQNGPPDNTESRRQPVEHRPRERSDGTTRDQGTPSRDRGRDRGRDRSRSRSRDRGRPNDRSRDRSRGRDAGISSRDRRSPPPSSSPAISRSRPEPGYGRRDSFEDGRDTKRPRSSRWGPPRPADSGEDNRPSAVDNRDREGSGRFENRSPRNRYDGPLGPGRAPGPGGYQGPPPPLRSGPPPNAFPPGPQGSGNGYGPPSRGGSDLGPPAREGGYAQGQRNYNGGPSGPSGEYQRPSTSTASPSGGEPLTGGPREVCRKFLAGQCTRGDRCWHLHDQLSGPDGAARARTELNQARRKTVLCANYPQGTCRFGDRCSFAHGEDDLDKSNSGTKRPTPLGQDSMRGPSPRGSSPHGSFQAQRQPTSPQKSFSSGTPNSYNRPPSAGMHAMSQSFPSYGNGLPSSHPSVANGGSMPGVAGGTYGQSQPGAGNNQWTGAAAASGYGGYGGGQSSQQFSSGGQAASSSVAVAPSRERAQSRDDDEGEANGPEFNLQYDEDE